MNETLVIDTSAFVAILLLEPDAAAISATIRRYRTRIMAAATYLECTEEFWLTPSCHGDTLPQLG